MNLGLSLLIACSFTVVINAQQLLSKIPESASIVATIKGENILDLLSVKAFSKSKMGQAITEKLTKESEGEITDISGLGIDFNNDFHYFIDVKDGMLSHCILIPLKNSESFLSLFSERDKAKIVTDGALSYIRENYRHTMFLWNKNTLLFINTINLPDEYNSFNYGTEGMVLDAEKEVEEVVIEAEKEDEEIIIETPAEETFDDMKANNYYNSEAYKKSEAAREKKFSNQIIENAKGILTGTYSEKSILSNSDYTKHIPGKKEEASIWVNDLALLYSQIIPNYPYGRYGRFNPYNFLDFEKIYGGVSATAILDFKEDAVAMEIQYIMNNDMAKWNKDMYNGTMNKSFVKYINEDRILGYMSLNMSTAGILRAYPNMINHMFNVKSKETISEAVALATKTFSILIDEDAASRIFRGDMVFVLTDLKEREVTYFDYKYDEEFNYTKVEKTKVENVPDFMLMFTSKEQDIYNRIMRIGVNENELILQENGIYKIKKMPKRFPLDVYIMYKDDAVFIGSSLADLTAIKAGRFVSKLSPKHKSNLLSSSYSAYANGKKIVSQLPANAFPRKLRQHVDFLTSNLEGMMLNVGKVKGNTIKGEFVWNTPEKSHKNSFAYFINMIDALMK